MTVALKGGATRLIVDLDAAELSQTQNGAGVATGPISGSGRGLSTPVGSQSGSIGANSFGARSGMAEASSDHPFRLPRASSLPSVRTSFRQAGDHPGHPSGKPAIVLFGSFPSGEPDFPTIRSSPGEPFESLPVSLRASSPGGLSQFLCPKAPVLPDSGKVGSALGCPAASRFFPAAPPERPWPPSRRISARSALAASRKSMSFPTGLP